jgi:calnexin
VVPQGWDAEEDGEWQAPQLPNPEFKGKWKVRPQRQARGGGRLLTRGTPQAPMIANPAYKGPWAPRQIANPNYFVDEQPSNLAKIGAVAVEILVNDAGISFDNILLGHDEAAAREFAALTFDPKFAEETRAQAQAKLERERGLRAQLWNEGVLGKVQYVVLDMSDAVLAHPFIAALALLASTLGLIYWCVFTGMRPPPRPEHSKEEEEEEEQEPQQQQGKGGAPKQEAKKTQ